MCIRQVQDDPSSYRLPLGIDDQTCASNLWSVLNPELDLDLTPGINLLHQLFWNLCGSFTRSSKEQWKEPLRCFIAVLNLTAGGTFRKATSVTTDLATWKHLLRAMVLLEIVLNKTEFSEEE